MAAVVKDANKPKRGRPRKRIPLAGAQLDLAVSRLAAFDPPRLDSALCAAQYEDLLILLRGELQLAGATTPARVVAHEHDLEWLFSEQVGVKKFAAELVGRANDGASVNTVLARAGRSYSRRFTGPPTILPAFSELDPIGFVESAAPGDLDALRRSARAWNLRRTRAWKKAAGELPAYLQVRRSAIAAWHRNDFCLLCIEHGSTADLSPGCATRMGKKVLDPMFCEECGAIIEAAVDGEHACSDQHAFLIRERRRGRA